METPSLFSSLLLGVSATASAVLMQFISDCMIAILPWIVVMYAVILLDLIVALRKCMLLREELRFSKGLRNTLTKIVAYSCWAVFGCTVNVICRNNLGTDLHLDVWACLSVVAIEFGSILTNTLKPKGYDFNPIKALAVVFNKFFAVDKADVESIITKDSNKE